MHLIPLDLYDSALNKSGHFVKVNDFVLLDK